MYNLFCRCERYRQQFDGLSPNGKATDSDSVIFKVRILVAQYMDPGGDDLPGSFYAREMA